MDRYLNVLKVNVLPVHRVWIRLYSRRRTKFNLNLVRTSRHSVYFKITDVLEYFKLNLVDL
eukprot:SAG31_NODE_14583_length_798_cov_0.878398_1_plen_61_part_00